MKLLNNSFRRCYEVRGESGIKHRFDLVINCNHTPYLVLDVKFNPSNVDILSFYTKCFDTKAKNTIFITSRLSEKHKRFLESLNKVSKVFIIELEH